MVVEFINQQKSYNSMEKVVSNTKSQINLSDMHSRKQDIEDAIQKAIDTETIRKAKMEKQFKKHIPK